jgi:hypothetical protein
MLLLLLLLLLLLQWSFPYFAAISLTITATDARGPQECVD